MQLNEKQLKALGIIQATRKDYQDALEYAQGVLKSKGAVLNLLTTAERLKELGLENKDPSDVLPVHSRETRESKDCPNITEDLVTFELNFTDGLKPTSILLQQVVKNDVSHETYGARYFGKEWIIGTANVRPYLNCLLWDSEDLVEAVRKMIVPPSSLPYNFSLPLEQLPATTLLGEVGASNTQR